MTNNSPTNYDTNHPRPVVLCILDGWGHREEDNNNAISLAKTPVWDRLTNKYPTSFLTTSSVEVGLPDGQMGNSEVGHMNLGAGRTMMQVLPRIDEASDEGFQSNKPLKKLIKELKDTNGAMHMMGLLSSGGVHSHMQHFAPLISIISEANIKIFLHLFLDGRDAPPKSALKYLHEFKSQIEDIKDLQIATISGRYFPMDRDHRWGRVAKGYSAITEGIGISANNPDEAINNGYERNETDEFIQPTVIDGFSGMNDGDGLLMMNFRSDRVRQILTALVDPEFTGFKRKKQILFSVAAGMTDYSEFLNKKLVSLFPQQHISNSLGELLANAGKRQLRIAETEKYAHVTFFFNGGEETIFTGEDRILVPSPKVATYDLKPEMSANEVTERLQEAIATKNYDFILVNYANTDMVGHSGNLESAIKAVETIDSCLGKLESSVIKEGGMLFITADHGNAEMMMDEETGEPHTAHTTFPVPAVLINAPEEITSLKNGRLADVAPTLLPFLGIAIPSEMDGKSLL